MKKVISIFNTNVDDLVYLHLTPLFLLSIVCYFPGIILRAIIFFLFEQCWPLTWRWKHTGYKTPGFPIVLNESCKDSYLWPIIGNVLADIISAIIIAVFIFYIWSSLRKKIQVRMQSVIDNSNKEE